MSNHKSFRDLLNLTNIRGTPEEKISIKDDNDIYNPYKTPADLDFAIRHGEAKKVYVSKPNELLLDKELCICCGLPLEGEKIPVTCDLSSLYHLGSGYTLYFQFVKHCIVLVIIMLGMSGIYNLMTNYQGGDCGDVPTTTGTQYCYEDFVTMFTIANKRNQSDELSVQLVLNLITVMVIAIYFQYIRYQTRKTVIAADDETITPADYTLQLKGIPQDATSDEEIKQWLEEQAEPDNPIKVTKICRAYKIANYIKDLRLKQELLARKAESTSEANTKDLDKQLRIVEDRLKDAKKRGLEHTDIVFAIFVQASHADYLKKKFEKSKFEKLLEIAKIIRTARDHFKGSKILLRRAPEPTDILWENLGSGALEKLTKRILIGLVTFLMVFGAFTFIVAISWVQILILESTGEESSFWVEVLNVVISIVVTAMDPIIGITVGKLVSHQKFSTYTGYYTAVAENLSISQFINTAFTTLFAKLVIAIQYNPTSDLVKDIQLTDFYGSGGVIKTTFYVFITNSFVNPISTLFDPPYMLKKYLQRKALKEGKNNSLTQKEANEIFEGQDFDIDWRYGYMVETMFFTAFFAPVMPMALVLTLVGLIISYWTEKSVFLKRAILPNSLSSYLQETMIEYLEWIAFLYALGNLIFYTNLQDSSGAKGIDNTPTSLIYLAIVFSLVHIFFPMQLLNEKLFPLIDEVTEFIDYDEARLAFLSDYDISNPVTSRKAIRELLALSEKKKLEDAKKTGKAPVKNVMLDYYKRLFNKMNEGKDEKEDDNGFDQLDAYSKEVMTPADILKRKLKKVDFTGIASKVNRGFAEGLGNMLINLADEVDDKETSMSQSQKKSLGTRTSQKKSMGGAAQKEQQNPPPSFGFFLNLLKNPTNEPATQPKSKKNSEKNDNELEMSLLGFGKKD